jgi:hypothetical protein
MKKINFLAEDLTKGNKLHFRIKKIMNINFTDNLLIISGFNDVGEELFSKDVKQEIKKNKKHVQPSVFEIEIEYHKINLRLDADFDVREIEIFEIDIDSRSVVKNIYPKIKL